jgi:HSP20 family protein
MPVHIIRVHRERSDMGSRPESSTTSYFYKDVGDLCTGTWEPHTDIFETDEEVIIRAELAGIDKKDVALKVKQGKLLISGIRRPLQSSDKMYFHQIEIKCGTFIKVIPLPHMLEHNEISAGLLDGILDIRISKREEAVEIPIEIKTMIITGE